MPSSKDFVRLFDGLLLVAKEAVKQKKQIPKGGVFEYQDLQSLAKKALISATDLTGLTKGRVRQFSVPNHGVNLNGSSRNNGDKESVVYFNQEKQREVETSQKPDEDTADKSVQASSLEAEGFISENDNVDIGEIHATNSSENLDHERVGYAEVPGVSMSTPGDNSEQEVMASVAGVTGPSSTSSLVKRQRKPRQRKVPSTPFSRAIGFAGLGAGLAWGTIQESAKRLVFGTPNIQGSQSAYSPLLSEKNAERLALALCRMRGAALKLGQMLSIQDESVVPAPILAALDIVRQGADVMPKKQLNQVLDSELGPDWSSKLYSFDYEPMAAASIGQVHKAVTKDGLEVAVKIQYPGVADSIESDIDNLKLLLKYTNLIPEKLYLDNAMKVAKDELSRECDYELEAMNQKRFRDLLSNIQGFYVPVVVDELSSKRVLTTELVPGIPIDNVALLDQETRNHVGKKLLELTLLELFVFHFMQTDPNWSNFLFDGETRLINLIDFGAARDYPKHFVDDYLRMVIACANNNREVVIDTSKRLGFITGMESDIMLEAHVQAGFVVGLPFSKLGGYDFGSSNITQSISNLGATMLRHRLTPPPDEAYSLHRKLSGAFLACIKLGAVVPCRELLLKIYNSYQFGEDSEVFYNRANS